MNTSKLLLFMITTFCSLIVFSQEKKDVYFILNDKDSFYALSYIMYDKKEGIIILSNRKEYEYHQSKIKEAKKNGTYYFDSESGRDNLNISVSNLAFKVLKNKKIKMNDDDFYKIKMVDYNWLLTEGWKQINGKDVKTEKPLSFKDIYFLKKISIDKYVSYKVGITMFEY